MGTRRVGLARTQSLIENLKRDLELTSDTNITCGSVTANTMGLGAVPATATAANSATQLTEGIYVRVDSGNNTDKAKMFLASHAGQMVIVKNVDDAQSFVLRNYADDASIATISAGGSIVVISTAAGDNWVLAVGGP